MQDRRVHGDVVPGSTAHHHDGLHLLLPTQVCVTHMIALVSSMGGKIDPVGYISLGDAA